MYFTYSFVLSLKGGKFHDQLTLLFLDLKTDKVPTKNKLEAGIDIAQKVINHLWKNVPYDDKMNVLFSIGRVSENDTMKGIYDTIRNSNHTPSLLGKVGKHVYAYDKVRRTELLFQMYLES